MKKGELVQASWTDAHFDFDNPTYRRAYTVESVGWVTRVDKQFLSIAQEITPDGHRGITHIPIVNILKVVKLNGKSTAK